MRPAVYGHGLKWRGNSLPSCSRHWHKWRCDGELSCAYLSTVRVKTVRWKKDGSRQFKSCINKSTRILHSIHQSLEAIAKIATVPYQKTLVKHQPNCSSTPPKPKVKVAFPISALRLQGNTGLYQRAGNLTITSGSGGSVGWSRARVDGMVLLKEELSE